MNADKEEMKQPDYFVPVEFYKCQNHCSLFPYLLFLPDPNQGQG